jgi:hypothetical protein
VRVLLKTFSFIHLVSAFAHAVPHSDIAKESLTKKSDPFFIVTRGSEILYRSEVIKDTSSPSWKPFTLATQVLAPAGVSSTFNIIVYDWDPDATYDLIGDTNIVSVRELFFPSPFFPLYAPGKSGRGELVLESTHQ